MNAQNNSVGRSVCIPAKLYIATDVSARGCMLLRGGEGGVPSRCQLFGSPQVTAHAQGQGRQRVRHQGSDQRSGP